MKHLAFIFLLTTFSLSCASKPLEENTPPISNNEDTNINNKDDNDIDDNDNKYS